MVEQEYLLKLEILQQEAERLGKENQEVTKQILELQELKNNLEYFEKTKNSQALVSFGRGIFTSANLEGKELLVNIGSNILVKKNVKETIELINEQLIKLEAIKIEIEKEMENLNNQAKILIGERHDEETD